MTYAEMNRDHGLTDGYTIKPKTVTQKIRTVLIDKTALPAGSTLDTNIDGTLKQVNLSTGVSNLNGTISVTPSSMSSHFSVTGNSFITIQDMENMEVPATYSIIAGQTNGNFVIMEVIMTK